MSIARLIERARVEGGQAAAEESIRLLVHGVDDDPRTLVERVEADQLYFAEEGFEDQFGFDMSELDPLYEVQARLEGEADRWTWWQA